jgi:hypothetical protein
MSKYRVRFHETVHYEIEVEAEDEAQAWRQVEEAPIEDWDRNAYDGYTELDSIWEVKDA